MKKLIIFIAAAVVMMLFVSCAEEAVDTPGSTESPTEAIVTEETLPETEEIKSYEYLFKRENVNELLKLPVLTEDEKETIIQAYVKNYEETYGKPAEQAYYNSKYNYFECYRSDNGIYAVKAGVTEFFGVTAQSIVTLEEPYEKDYWFCYPDMEVMYIYTDGRLYSLESAYMKGVIDEEYVISLYITYRGHNEHLYTGSGDYGPSLESEIID